MGYSFHPNNKDLETFEMGAFSWPVLTEAFGSMFPFWHKGPKWYFVKDVDPRFNADYPAIVANSGFAVTEEEARWMARMARNFVIVQKSLELGGEIWPDNMRVRDDFLDKYEQFADWAEKSGGFSIW